MNLIQEFGAKRIIACVNACKGVDNETLEKIARGEMDGSEIVELAKVKRHRDELLVVIKAIREGCAFPEDVVQKAIRDRCQEIIENIDWETP